MSESTNILIVGNGFDLSHYLPTKYEHFISAMQEIEKWDISKGDMSFDDIFQSINQSFIAKTKQYFFTDNLFLNTDEILKIKELLIENGWYKYFKNHLEEIETWIDFEQKIKELLLVLTECIIDMQKINNPNKIYEYFQKENAKNPSTIKIKNLKYLENFNFISSESYKMHSIQLGRPPTYSERNNINPLFCHGNKIKNGFNPSSTSIYVLGKLESLIEIFNTYLKVVSNLKPKNKFKIGSDNWFAPEKVFSFNYTNTYQRLYDEEVEIDFLHGKSGNNQNMVLGVSDIEDEALKKIKAYGFTKYQQKLFKDTDYLFLNNYKDEISSIKQSIERLEKSLNVEIALNSKKDVIDEHKKSINDFDSQQKLNLKFFIWGHSLDESDKEYILDLFSLNDDIDRNVRIIVYYFDSNAKFSLLNNLLHILNKEKVEQWMKNKWLEFKPNPTIDFGV